MIYAAFSVYLLGIFLMAMGTYRLWADMLRARWVNWALLPGTVVAEMAYIFGCLITGGEVRRAKLMGGASSNGRRSKRSSSSDEAEPTTESTPRLRHVGPVIAAFMTILACGAGIVLVHALLGEPVIAEFVVGTDRLLIPAELPKELPTSTGTFWDQVIAHVGLLRRMCGTWLELDWLDWRVPLFVYLATCLTIRLAPVRRSLRASLAAAVALAGLIGLTGLAWGQFSGLMDAVWPLLTYVWSSLLFLLAVSLIARGLVGLTRALLTGETADRS